MRELSVVEQRYQAVQAAIGDGETVTGVAARFGGSRQTVHAWLAKYDAGGLDGLGDRSHRPVQCPHQMPAVVEAAVLQRVALGVGGLSVSVRAGLVEPARRRRRSE
jgi:transposase-like protein